MALPTLQKTWHFNINNKRANQSNLAWHQNLMRDIKDALINNSPAVAWTDAAGAPSVPAGIWTVDHSCDSAVAGTPADGVDRWIDNGDMIWDRPGDPHSWMVLNTGGIGGLLQVLIDLDNRNSATAGGTPESIASFISGEGDFGSGGSAGTTTDRPTASINQSEITRGDGTVGDWAGNQSSNGLDIAWHMMMSSDGAELRIFMLRDSVCFAIWAIGETVGFADDVGTDRPWFGSIWSTTQATPVECGKIDSVEGWLHAGSSVSSEENKVVCGNGNLVNIQVPHGFHSSGNQSIWQTGLLGGVADETNNKQIAAEISLWDIDSIGSRGPRGRLKDIWVCKNDRLIGSTYPADGSRQFHQIGENILVPWNGVIPENFF